MWDPEIRGLSFERHRLDNLVPNGYDFSMRMSLVKAFYTLAQSDSDTILHLPVECHKSRMSLRVKILSPIRVLSGT